VAFGVVPTCRYHQVPLERQIDPQLQNASAFTLTTGSSDGATVYGGRGYFLEVWKCPKCSYLELHDFEVVSR
jgi:hypothetical protein